MSLSNIRQANKKAKHERNRKAKRNALSDSRNTLRVRRGRIRKMHDQGRKEMRSKRAREVDHVNELMAELSGDV